MRPIVPGTGNLLWGCFPTTCVCPSPAFPMSWIPHMQTTHSVTSHPINEGYSARSPECSSKLRNCQPLSQAVRTHPRGSMSRPGASPAAKRGEGGNLMLKGVGGAQHADAWVTVSNWPPFLSAGLHSCSQPGFRRGRSPSNQDLRELPHVTARPRHSPGAKCAQGLNFQSFQAPHCQLC